mgnify:CR=1 FL=1
MTKQELIADEAGQMSLKAFETALQRVAMLQGQVVLTTTPYNLGWLLTEVVQRLGEGNRREVVRKAGKGEA